MWAYATHEVKSIIYLFIYLFYSFLFQKRTTEHTFDLKDGVPV